MARKYVDCRLFPSEMNCTVAISADSEKELIEAAVQHAVAVHKHHDTPEFRAQIKESIPRKGRRRSSGRLGCSGGVLGPGRHRLDRAAAR